MMMEAALRRRAFPFFTLCLVFLVAVVHPLKAEDLFVGEVLGEITGSSVPVFLQLGPGIENDLSFKAGYDVTSHASAHDYAFETPLQTGLVDGARLDFILDGLTAERTYYYSIAYREYEGGEWHWRPEGHFQTTRGEGTPFRFCVLADMHYLPITPTKQQLCQNVEADSPDFVVTLGDMIPAGNQAGGEPIDCEIAYNPLPGGIHSQEDAEDHYRSFMANLMNFFSHSSMIVWINGNHEGLTGFQSTCPQYDYILSARKKCLPLLAHDEPNAFYGDLVWGDVHLLWLDPLAFAPFDPLMRNEPRGYVLGTEQAQWLNDTLAGSESRWKLIFAHSLFGGTGPSFECSPGSAYARGNANFVDSPGTDQIVIQSLMETYGVQAYIYGHDHLYSASEHNGIKYITAGLGAPPNWSDCLENYYLPWKTVKEPGHLRVDVSQDSLSIQYIKAATDASNGEFLGSEIIE